MANHSETLASSLSRRLWKRHSELAPPAGDAEILASFADPPDPVGFARHVLRFMPWSRQQQILEAVAEYQRVAVVSGHKVGKSTAYAILALWFYCSFPNARVVITATTDNQVNGIIWREIKRLVRSAAIPIPGAPCAIRANTGLTHPETFSEIRGYTAKEAEAIAGVSGSHVMYLVDEASGVEDFIFQAIEGNRAGGNAWVLLCSNPTKADGEFYEAFHSKSRDTIGDAGYYNIHVDSRESPNITGEWRELEEWCETKRGAGDWAWRKRSKPVPGLATAGWVAEKQREWGEDSAFFNVRIKGSFVIAEAAKVFQLALLQAAQTRWEETEPAPSDPLVIGLDPAGDGDGGDESSFTPRRGLKVYRTRSRRGISPAEHIEELRDIIREQRALGAPASPKPLVNCESEGEASWKVYVVLREHAERTGEFNVQRMRTSSAPMREPLIYDRFRDELWAIARAWMRAGGAIPPDASRLEKDLHAPEYSSTLAGKLKITAKRDLRKLLGRSPDDGDSFVLSCFVPRRYATEEAAEAPAVPQADAYEMVETSTDPYGSSLI
jgi:phage terminase large subunit